MEKALETVKKREDRRKENKNFKPNKFENKEKSFKKNEKKEVKTEEVKKEEKKEEVSLDKMTVAELRELAKEKDIKGYSTMKKAELLDALK